MNEGEESNPSFNDSEPEMFDNELEASVKQQNLTLNDSDSEAVVEVSPTKEPPKQRKLGPIMQSDDDTPVKKPKATKRTKIDDSDFSEEEKQKKVFNQKLTFSRLSKFFKLFFYFRANQKRRRPTISAMIPMIRISRKKN